MRDELDRALDSAFRSAMMQAEQLVPGLNQLSVDDAPWMHPCACGDTAWDFSPPSIQCQSCGAVWVRCADGGWSIS